MVNCNEANCTCKMVNCVRHGKCCECINPVSYTHLDVYKRQLLVGFIMLVLCQFVPVVRIFPNVIYMLSIAK